MSDLEEGICGWMTVNFLLDLVGSTGRQTDRQTDRHADSLLVVKIDRGD